MICIYKITSPTNRTYIGQTINLKDRISRYKALSCKRQKLLYSSFLKYGFKNHVFEVLEECDSRNLDEREVYWIDFYKSNLSRYNNDNGMNLTDGGGGIAGYKHTKECIEVMRAIRKNISNETRNKMSLSKYNIERKKVYKYSVEGCFIGEFESVVKAYNDIFGSAEYKRGNGISHCLKGRRKSAYGYVWSYDMNYNPILRARKIKLKYRQ